MLKFIFTSSFEGGQWRWVCWLHPTLNNFSSFQFPVVREKMLGIHRWPASTPLSQGYKYFPSVYYYFCFTYSILFHPLSWFFSASIVTDIQEISEISQHWLFCCLKEASLKIEVLKIFIFDSPFAKSRNRHTPHPARRKHKSFVMNLFIAFRPCYDFWRNFI